jgi:prepilin-type processing-associated H-X9-DG protein
VGEGVSGPDWTICEGVGCDQPAETTWNPGESLPDQAWIVPLINTEQDVAAGYLAGSLFGSTIEPLNKNPVTDTMMQSTDIDDCRSSTDGGPHRTSNFRSNHSGGANFLFADGSVRFINEDIDMTLYRRLSTIAGGEKVGRVPGY